MCKKKACAEQKAAYSGCGCFVSSYMCIFLLEKVYFKDPVAGLEVRQRQGESIDGIDN